MKMGVNIYYLELIFFTEYFVAVEIDEKHHTDSDFMFDDNRQEAIEKKIVSEFIRINTCKERYDADYEATRIQIFISKFGDRQVKKNYKKWKE